MTTPRRLPAPGRVSEPCRVCGAPLEVSLANPRRVCAQCGEVNLPSDGAAAPASARGPRDPALSPRWIGTGVALALLPALAGAVAAAFLEATQRPRGGLMSGFDFVGPTVTFTLAAEAVSLAVLVALIARARPRPWLALAWWVLAQVPSVPLFLAASMWLMNLRRH